MGRDAKGWAPAFTGERRHRGRGTQSTKGRKTGKLPSFSITEGCLTVFHTPKNPPHQQFDQSDWNSPGFSPVWDYDSADPAPRSSACICRKRGHFLFSRSVRRGSHHPRLPCWFTHYLCRAEGLLSCTEGKAKLRRKPSRMGAVSLWHSVQTVTAKHSGGHFKSSHKFLVNGIRCYTRIQKHAR